jgi:hypothetical protein
MSDTSIKPSRNWMKIILVLSLGLNLAVAGAVGGALLSGKGAKGDKFGSGKGRNVRMAPGFTPYIRALDPAVRREMGQILRQTSKAREGRNLMRAELSATLPLIEAEVFDRAQMEQVLEQQTQAFQRHGIERALQGRTVLLDVLEQMSLAERRAYSEKLRQAISQTSKRP